MREPALAPVGAPFIAADIDSVGETPTLAFAPVAEDVRETTVRRLTFTNTHPTQDLVILVVPVGASAASLTLADGVLVRSIDPPRDVAVWGVLDVYVLGVDDADETTFKAVTSDTRVVL
jgi:hypothetical protein